MCYVSLHMHMSKILLLYITFFEEIIEAVIPFNMLDTDPYFYTSLWTSMLRASITSDLEMWIRSPYESSNWLSKCKMPMCTKGMLEMWSTDISDLQAFQ